MLPSQVEFLKHIMDECNYLLLEYRNNSFADLLNNKRLSNAVCRSLEIIGRQQKISILILKQNTRLLIGKKWQE
jgi:uncharacterized protein with HEPN domain